VGNRAIAEFFIDQGIEPNICVLAMLGREQQVKTLLKRDASLANARGAHGIGVLFHAAMGGNMEIMNALRDAGCNEGYNFALHGAVNFRHEPVIKWLLQNGVTDQATKDFQGKTPLEKAQAWGNTEVVSLLENFHSAH
jgi:ankyrin repeat protein